MAKPNALGLVGKRQVILGSAILGIVLAAVIAIVCVFSVEGVSLTGEEPSSQIKGGSTIRTTTSTTSSGPTGEAANVDTTTTTSRGPVTSRTTITSPTGTTVQMPDTGDNTGVVQDANIIAYLDTYPIEREEFQFYAARNRALVAQNFKTVYNAKVTDDFWTTKYGDDTPEEMLREEALEELINTKAELILMKEYGIIKDISYSAFIKEWIDTNTARSQALRRGANLYGPVQFPKEQYFRYWITTNRIKLEKALGKTQNPSASTLQTYYGTIKGKYQFYLAGDRMDPTNFKPYSEVAEDVYYKYLRTARSKAVRDKARELEGKLVEGVYRTVDILNIGTLDVIITASSEETYITYYVDSMDGNDANDGKTPQTAWRTLSRVNHMELKPGTRILFKAGSIFNGYLAPVGNGEAGRKIVFDRYGSGPAPIINGDGSKFAVQLRNMSYVELRNVEITNYSAVTAPRYGVLIQGGGSVSDRGGAIKGVRLFNVNVHDVSSETNRSYGGIVVTCASAASPVWFEDLTIDGCSVTNSGANGISVKSDWCIRGAMGEEWSVGDWTPSTNLKLCNTYVEACAGDGIWVSVTKNALLTNNICNNTSYGNNTAYAGIWPHNSDGCIMQNNEAYGQILAGNDAQGFDVDINCQDTTVQYNYSHDNDGGFLLICTYGAEGYWNRNVIVRYNLSENDRQYIFSLGGKLTNVKIYNNTVYIPENSGANLMSVTEWGYNVSATGLDVFNNLFYVAGNGFSSGFVPSAEYTFRNNMYFGAVSHRPIGTDDLLMDPKIVKPGGGPAGYKLKNDSPCIDKGVNTGVTGLKDFFGQSIVDACDIGMAEHH